MGTTDTAISLNAVRISKAKNPRNPTATNFNFKISEDKSSSTFEDGFISSDAFAQAEKQEIKEEPLTQGSIDNLKYTEIAGLLAKTSLSTDRLAAAFKTKVQEILKQQVSSIKIADIKDIASATQALNLLKGIENIENSVEGDSGLKTTAKDLANKFLAEIKQGSSFNPRESMTIAAEAAALSGDQNLGRTVLAKSQDVISLVATWAGAPAAGAPGLAVPLPLPQTPTPGVSGGTTGNTPVVAPGGGTPPPMAQTNTPGVNTPGVALGSYTNNAIDKYINGGQAAAPGTYQSKLNAPTDGTFKTTLDKVQNIVNALQQASNGAAGANDAEANARIQMELGKWMAMFNALINLEQKIFFMYAKAGKGWLDVAERLA